MLPTVIVLQPGATTQKLIPHNRTSRQALKIHQFKISGRAEATDADAHTSSQQPALSALHSSQQPGTSPAQQWQQTHGCYCWGPFHDGFRLLSSWEGQRPPEKLLLPLTAHKSRNVFLKLKHWAERWGIPTGTASETPRHSTVVLYCKEVTQHSTHPFWGGSWGGKTGKYSKSSAIPVPKSLPCSF